MDSTCSIDGCTRRTKARGWCNRHWLRWSRHGDPLAGGAQQVHGTPEQRFWPKVDQNGPAPDHRPELGPCWVWTAATNNRGYPQFGLNGRMVLAYRFAYELLVGPIPDGLDLDHLCRRPTCVRPDHLDPVTNAENAARTVGFNYAERCRSGQHAMTPDNVRVTSTGIRVCRTCVPGVREDMNEVCPNGHPRDAENVVYNSAGHRCCRSCRRDTSREVQRRRRARLKAAQDQ